MTRRKIVIIVTALVLTAIISVTLAFIIPIRYSGEFTVEFRPGELPDNLRLEAQTPFGRKVEIHFIENKASFSGFYRQVLLISDCNKVTAKIRVSHGPYVFSYEIADGCTDGKTQFALPVEPAYGIGFLSISKDVFGWLISTNAFQDAALGVVFVIIAGLSYLIFRRFKSRKNTGSDNPREKAIKIIAVFFSGLLFWIVIVLLVSELSLRIFGSFYADVSSVEELPASDSAFTVLCIGDSFTYGIGATKDKSYPEQLKEIIETREKIPVRVINAGVCAGNTTQMLENTQVLLDKYRPDAVVMLFEMANSWNYYGFSQADNFLYRIKIYKLYKRIAQNIAYKKHGFEMFRRVDDFAVQQLLHANKLMIQDGLGYDAAYYTGRFYMAHQNATKAIDWFALSGVYNPACDSLRNALWVCVEKIDAAQYFSDKYTSPIERTVVPATISHLDSLMAIYPEAIDLNIVKYRYLAVKGDTASALEIIRSMTDTYSMVPVIYYDLLRYNPTANTDFITRYSENKPEYAVFEALIALRDGNSVLAESKFRIASDSNPENTAVKSALFLIERWQTIMLETNLEKREEAFLQCLDSLLRISGFNQSDNARYIEQYKTSYASEENTAGSTAMIMDTDKFSEGKLFGLIISYFDLTENLHESFFLVHKNKRSMNLRDKEVFDWIATDINIITDICLKQSYRLICMNYPLIPPPNSEEISYWAAGTGEIWKKTASAKSISFVNQDSLFSLYGEQKQTLFEPAFTGSEHCNEKGYGLMAENIYYAMKIRGWFNQIKFKP